VYAENAKRAADRLGFEVTCAENWGRHPKLLRAYAEKLGAALSTIPDLSAVGLVLTAHSLPKLVIDAGDPYEKEVRASAEALASDFMAAVGGKWVAFQSQGLGEGDWLGPDLRSTFEEVARQGLKHVVVVPIGFLADHVEILYDLDIEAKGWAEELGLAFSRTESLNSGEAIVHVLSELARGLA
jgi:ferrochelatase